ncbi:MAG: type II toxin-antitoxin system RelE/ParE family toxin [Treponema sp.]|nr:type II toxin-antitoxin system RelE/ParE family toxin [Treponema sp.]
MSCSGVYRSSNTKSCSKITWVLKAVQEIEKVPKTYFKKLVDTDFYEVRIELTGNIYRLLGFFHNGNIVILTNGFQKKTQKTPKSEIEVCEERMKDFLKRSKEDAK